MSEAREGYIWVPDTAWRVPTQYEKCRGTRGCPGQPVADLNRYFRMMGRANWWAYCVDHLYGRRLRNGVIEIEVRCDSPHAPEYLAAQFRADEQGDQGLTDIYGKLALQHQKRCGPSKVI